MEYALSKKGLRHEPQRTCLGCRTVANKCDLLRFRRVKNDVVRTRDKKNLEGRGAYLHKKISCIQNAVNAGLIERDLGVPSNETIHKLLNEQIIKLEKMEKLEVVR